MGVLLLYTLIEEFDLGFEDIGRVGIVVAVVDGGIVVIAIDHDTGIVSGHIYIAFQHIALS